MAKIDAVRRLSLEDIPGAPEEIEPLLTQQGDVNETVIGALRGNLSFADNTTSGYFTDNFTHGVERIIKNPLKVSPSGVQSVLVEKLPTDAPNAARQRVKSIDLRYINGKDPKAPEQLGVTVYYDLVENDRIMVTRTSNQTAIASSSEATLQWSGVCTTMSLGSSLQWDSGSNTRVTVLEAGDYEIRAHVAWNSNSTGQRCVYINVGGTRMGAVETHNASTFFTQLDAIRVLPLVAGDYITMSAVQVSGGNLDLLGGGALTTSDDAGRNSLTVRRVRNSTTPKARVTLFLHGG